MRLAAALLARFAAAALALGWGHVAYAKSFTVTVVAVDAENKPVAKADAALFWDVKDGAMTPAGNKGVTDAAGKAVVRVDDWDEKRPVLVLSADRKLGGYAGVSRADAGKELTVTLGPTVRVSGKFACPDLGITPTWMNTTVTRKGFRAFNAQHVTKTGDLTFTLPAGDYSLSCYGDDVEGHKRPLELDADRSGHDLGVIDLTASVQAKLKGKVPPPWTLADARGVPKSVQLADYKGKWVYLEFWGHWCGPCVAGGLPEAIGLYDDHKDHLDRFAVIAVHDSSVKSFAELDPKLKSIKERYWQGRELPFPVVIDADRSAQTLFGISHWPTGLLIDPAGKLVGEVSAEEFEAKLPPLPAAVKWARHRDMAKNVSWEFGREYTLAKLAATLTRWAGNTPVTVDPAALAAAGLSADGPLPGALVGYDLTLRDAEEFLLAPHGLGVVPAADGKSLRLTARPADAPPAAPRREKATAERLDQRVSLAALTGKAKPLQLDGVPLADAVKLLANEFDLPFALDAQAAHAKALDPAVKLTGSVGPADLRAGLAALLAPHKLAVEVRRGVVVVAPAR